MDINSIKSWLKDRCNFTFLIILVLGAFIRILNLIATKGQALWWDEADYLAYAKNLAGFDIGWIIAEAHNSIYPYLAALIFKFGLGELAVKFLLQVVPSILSIVLVYFLSNEMYKDKRIGVVVSFLMTFFWIHLFNTSRFHVDILGLFFGLISIYIFWKGFEKKEKIFGRVDQKWTIPLTALFAVLAYSTRRGYFLFGIFIATFILLTRSWKEISKDKYNWIGLILGIVLILFVEKVIFISGLGAVGEQYFHEELPISFAPLSVFKSFFKIGGTISTIPFYLFWVGLILIISKLALSFGYIKKDALSKANLLNLLIIAITLIFFMVVLRSPPEDVSAEPRWYLPLAFSAFACIGLISVTLLDSIKKQYNHLGLIIIIALILIFTISGYSQYKIADEQVKSKVASYAGIREASLFLKEIASKEDKILTLSQPQVEYYSERSTLNARVWAGDPRQLGTSAHFDATLLKIQETPSLRFLVIAFLEGAYPEWACNCNNWAQSNIMEIPFMDTRVELNTGQQDIKPEISYGNLTFKLITIKNEVFVYEISRSDTNA